MISGQTVEAVFIQRILQKYQHSLPFVQLAVKEPCAVVWRNLEVFKTNAFLLDLHPLYNDSSYLPMDLGNW